MQKFTKPLIIGIVSFIILLLIAFTWIFFSQKTLRPTSPVAVAKRFSDLPAPPTMASAAIAADPDLTLAKNILDHISLFTDKEGFYSRESRCDLDGSNCQILYADAATKRASHRENLPIIWARFKYFERTSDNLQYNLLLDDIDNLYGRVTSNEWVLQPDSLNCALMQELYFSPYLPEEYHAKVKQICNDSRPEYHPQSIITRDQHWHPVFDFVDPTINRRNIAVPDEQSYAGLDNDQKMAFTSDFLFTQIADNLAALTNMQPGSIFSFSSQVSKDDQNEFITREMLTAIDNAFAAKINQSSDPQVSADLTLDHLILFNEALSWFTAYPNWERSLDSCVVRAGITHLAQTYPSLLTIDQLTTIQSMLVSTDNYGSSWRCAIANYLAGLPSQAALQLENTRQLLTPAHWSFGYAYEYEGQLNFNNNVNAIYAGLLASGK